VLTCANCGTPNDPTRKFCIECGTRLATGCPVCGSANPADAKFCGECGTALAAESGVEAPRRVSATAEAPIAERRLVSVLFADLVGHTSASERRDAEDTRDLLSRYFETAREIVERHGGTIEKFIGDAVMAVWGTPTAHEDDAERAVRSALQLLDAIGHMESGDGKLLQGRAGVLTGEAAVTIGAIGQGMVAGDLVNTASRLQSVAAPGTVLVGEATYRAASGAISFERADDQHLKGKESPVPSWRAVTVVARRGGSGRAAILEPPFVGRDEELRLLKEQFHATERERKPRLVTLAGQAGIGKSRLGWELEKYIDGVVDVVWWHEGRSPSYGEGISYWALAEMIRGRAGIAETDDPATARTRLQEALEQYVPDLGERHWIEPRLAGLLGLEELPTESREELFAAWRSFFERMAQQNPVLLVFWDLQWADQGLLDFIEYLLTWARSSPIFVLAEARPELFDRRPGWGTSVRSAALIHLEPMDDYAMEQLLTGLVPNLPKAALGAVIERAAGIPLYAVETLRILLDRGVLEADGDQYRLVGDLPELSIPETLHALIAARLDALDPNDRTLITDASVLGLSFSVPALEALANLAGEELTQRLDRLVRHELLVLDVDPRSAERGQYRFVQGVVREVAYQSLAKRDRRTRHLAAARYFESLGEDDLTGVLASHYMAAHQTASPGPEADALAAQARIALRAAAQRAADLHNPVGALAYLEQALEVTTEPMERAALHEAAVQVAGVAARVQVGVSHAREAERIYAQANDRMGVLRSRTLDAWIKLSEHNNRDAVAVLEAALAEVADVRPSGEIARAQAQLARAYMVAGNPDAVALADRVLENPALVSPSEIVDTLITKGSALLVERPDEAQVILRGAVVVADRMGDLMASSRARNNMLGAIAERNALEAAQMNRQAYETAVRFGLRTWIVQAVGVGRRLGFDTGEWDAWETEMEAEVPGAEAYYRAWFDQTRAERLIFQGNPRMAETAMREIIGREAVQANAQAHAGYMGDLADAEAIQGHWRAAFATARQGWDQQELARYPILSAILAAAGGGDLELLGQVPTAFPAIVRDEPTWGLALHQMRLTLTALLEKRWDEGRALYLEARRSLEAVGFAAGLARLQLAVGHLGAGRFADADDAATAAEGFFHDRGADGYVTRYLANAVQPGEPPTVAGSNRPSAQKEAAPLGSQAVDRDVSAGGRLSCHR